VIKVRYFPAAEQELLDEIAYLESQSPGLGRRFLTEVNRVESEILNSQVRDEKSPQISENLLCKSSVIRLSILLTKR
jgi:hypothetical protein